MNEIKENRKREEKENIIIEREKRIRKGIEKKEVTEKIEIRRKAQT